MKTVCPGWGTTRAAARLLALLTACALSPCLAAGSDGVNLTDYGGVCDGVADNSAAIARGLADAKAKNVPLVIPAGQCNFSQVIRMDGVKLTGSGASSVLYAPNWQVGAIFLTGSGSSVSYVKLTGPVAPSRVPDWETTKITAFGTDFVIDHVTIEGPTGGPVTNGIMVQGAARGRITNNTIRNTLADSIHMTGGTSQIVVENNFIENAGDDGIAVVSYQSDGRRVNNITARNNVIRSSKYGRNMSVVGGQTILYENNLVQTNLAGLACLYIAQENSYTTFSALDVTVKNNTFQNCGGSVTGHAAVMIFSDGAEANNNITLQNNDVIQNGQDGIRYFGPQTNVRLDNNRIAGAGSAYVGDAVAGVTVNPYTSGSIGYVAP